MRAPPKGAISGEEMMGVLRFDPETVERARLARDPGILERRRRLKIIELAHERIRAVEDEIQAAASYEDAIRILREALRDIS